MRRAYSKSRNDFSPADVALEAAKYITKFDDLLSFGDALPQFSRQVLGIRTLNSGGIVKDYISQTQLDSIDDKIEHGVEEKIYDVGGSFQLVFDDTINRYRRTCDGKIFNESVIVDN
ncbi:hypothetical protein OSCI_1210001 [Kamptonema sp. PCC 6506]|nr:hypothetical protein OSCI_1210001 [Kamptonema sp. PCC 6506]